MCLANQIIYQPVNLINPKPSPDFVDKSDRQSADASVKSGWFLLVEFLFVLDSECILVNEWAVISFFACWVDSLSARGQESEPGRAIASSQKFYKKLEKLAIKQLSSHYLISIII